ncbi:MAG: UvrD-helicase domain-containing protein [Acidobacteria bacterium]|nr:UvrD-helicase domain-containing protein [Acidobacteriota bacterium]MCA1643548.1 UvrD-helicase domain-containing protein [Acidobacteriota bacterium]
MDLLSSLNERQREAVTTTEGPLLILAGAGSGKTRVIVHRIAYLIAERGIAPHSILAVTFTNKAAGEMRERVTRLLASERLQSAPLISTFHSLCVRILRVHIERLQEGYTRSFTIYDQDDSVRVVKSAVKDLGYDNERLGARSVQSAISHAKNQGLDAEAYAARVESSDERRAAIARVFKLYEERLVSSNALDFDDLMIKTVRLLRKDQQVRDQYNEKFRYILVDEYQDTNSLQFALIRFLTEKQQNVCVVGDESQCVVAGTRISTSRGSVKAEDVRAGDAVLSAKGNGQTQLSRVARVRRRPVVGKPVVTINTKRGFSVTATPEHVHFARYLVGDGAGDDLFFTYLMHKRGVGFRVGVTRRYRFAGASGKTLGFIQRLNQERADAVWLLEACKTEEEARFRENFYAATYGLPTVTFRAVAGTKMPQESIDRLFASVDTDRGARALLADKQMSFEHPHHTPKCTTLRRRRNFSVTLCKDARHNTLHYCEVLGSDMGDSERLRAVGIATTAHKRVGWRVRMATGDFGKVVALHEKVSGALGGVNVILKATLTAGTALHFTPASHVLPGMRVYVNTPRGVEQDEVVSVERETYTGTIYDFDIERTHNYVANNVYTHNSIYRWRGADISNILNFEEVYPEAKSIKLEQNYRSTQTILDVADAVIKNNTERKDKTLWTANPAGARVFYYQALDADSEARFVAAKIEEHRRQDPSARAAVLYRTNAQSRVFEEAMRRAGLQYNIVGGFSFYERAEVRDIIGYLKLAMNPHDSVALMRVINTPPRGLGKQTLDELARRAKDYGVSLWETLSIVTDPKQVQTGFAARASNSLKNFQKIITDLVALAQKEPASEVVKAAILDSGYAEYLKTENSEEAESRLENLQELVNAAVDYDAEEGGGLRDFIDSAALVSDADDYERDAPVTLMTMHSAKGLEFPVVFIVGLEDGLFPHSRSAADPAELEEERRLCYVAITRAEQVLYVSHAMKRRVYGEEMASEPSQFLNEMPPDLLEDLTRGASWLSFARSSSRMESVATARALRGEPRREQRRFEGKTYDSVESIADFFRQRGQQVSQHTPRGEQQRPAATPPPQQPVIKRRGETPDASATGSASSGFVPGTHVRHAKYGRGLVLRREGVGDSAKLTVSFPGFGQKKLIEKYAGLEKE